MIVIDGSAGEGGGQMLRTALSLSLVTGKPFRIERIRARRARPGLLRQHLAALRAAAAIGKARVEGDVLGAATVSFEPGRVTPGHHRIDIGSAGSTTLVAQTLIPALLRGPGPSRIVIVGGTHNPLAPPFEFLDQAFVPLLNRMGGHVMVTLGRPGFFPRGAGEMTLSVEPVAALAGLDLCERGELVGARAIATVAHLPRSIAERELRALGREITSIDLHGSISEDTRAFGPGNFVVVLLNFRHVTEVFSGIGQKGVPAETVAHAAAIEVNRFLASGAAVGPHLADQLLLPVALAGHGRFTTVEPTRHTQTNAALIERFLPVTFDFRALAAGRWRIEATAASPHR